MYLRKDEILLRAIEEKDAPVLHCLINDPNIEKMVLGWSRPVSERQQMEWIQAIRAEDVRFMIEVNGEAVGTIFLTELDFKNSSALLNIKLLQTEYGNKGIGTKSLQLLMEYCFDELNLHCLYAYILEYNQASQRLFEKCGFVKEGVLRQRIYKQGRYHDVIAYSFIKGVN